MNVNYIIDTIDYAPCVVYSIYDYMSVLLLHRSNRIDKCISIGTHGDSKGKKRVS